VAEEALLPDGEEEPLVAPEGEAEVPEKTIEENPEVNDADPIETLAVELGWAPKDQFRGDPEDWKPADEFIREGRNIQRNVSRELKDVRQTLDNMSRTSATLLEQQLARQKQELETKYAEAIELGDGQTARHIDRQIAEIETRATTAVPTNEGAQFAERHSSWYGKNQEATNYAVSRAGHYAAQGLAPARQLTAVEQDMRQIFPELFPKPAKAPPAVAPPVSRTATPSNRKKSFHDMPAAAQTAARDMADRGVIPNVDAYVENYFNQPERKVG
jgi:hypothetical protein